MAAEPQPSKTDQNVEAYTQQRARLEAEHLGQYVAIANGRIVGVYPGFDEARKAVEPNQHKLVFQIGEEPDLGPLHRSSSFRKLGRVIGD
jgi:hypothetical protein